jgi:hypothetical protein
MPKIISPLTEQVTKILRHQVIARDEDTSLLVLMWKQILRDRYPSIREPIAVIVHPDGTQCNSIDEILDKFIYDNILNGTLPLESSISRCRRKIQENCAELRGSKWDERHGSQTSVLAEIEEIPSLLNSFYTHQEKK